MTKSFPYLALDSAGKRTILCDYPVKMFDNTTKKETTKVKTLSRDQLSHYVGMSIKNPAAADRYWARCMGRDSAFDDETAARIKEFLSDKLSDKDHTKLCNMLDGTDDVEAQDTEPPLDGLSARQRMQATDSMIAKHEKNRDDFFAQFPDAARIRVDTSGIPLRGRASNYSADGAASFAAMFPDAARIKVL